LTVVQVSQGDGKKTLYSHRLVVVRSTWFPRVSRGQCAGASARPPWRPHVRDRHCSQPGKALVACLCLVTTTLLQSSINSIYPASPTSSQGVLAQNKKHDSLQPYTEGLRRHTGVLREITSRTREHCAIVTTRPLPLQIRIGNTLLLSCKRGHNPKSIQHDRATHAPATKRPAIPNPGL